MPSASALATEKTEALRQGAIQLEYFTIFWNGLEALVAILAGLVAGSIALVGFGLDSVIEVVSGVALLWRLQQRGELESRAEARALDRKSVV